MPPKEFAHFLIWRSIDRRAATMREQLGLKQQARAGQIADELLGYMDKGEHLLRSPALTQALLRLGRAEAAAQLAREYYLDSVCGDQ